jgi:hypothetical protein
VAKRGIEFLTLRQDVHHLAVKPGRGDRGFARTLMARPTLSWEKLRIRQAAAAVFGGSRVLGRFLTTRHAFGWRPGWGLTPEVRSPLDHGWPDHGPGDETHQRAPSCR